YYKRHDPSSSEEQECMENMFDALCSVLLVAENKERFLSGIGNDHLEPTVGDYEVELLNDLLVRLIGEYIE
ncbi:MAG: hypothetical protein AAGD05_06350, partial [Bacteroidota bacterium]